jgi:poly-gamma-glutamate synthesis protein (capsule biosynthesis protein)
MSPMPKKSVTLVAGGDVMLGEHPLCIGFGVDSVIEQNGTKFIFDNIAPTLRKADIAFCNLENMLLDKLDRKERVVRFEDKYFRGRKESINALKHGGFNIVNIANNHALQHGPDVLYGTTKLLDEAKIKHIGVSGSNEAIFNFDIMRIGFIGYCDDQQYEKTHIYVEPIDLNQIGLDIKTLKRAGVGYIVVSLHWGDEFIDKPSAEQVETARAIIDMGANLILGHHPHVLQGIEHYKNGVIAFSLGSFVGDSQWDVKLTETFVLSCEIFEDGKTDVNIIPVFINNMYQPEIASTQLADKIGKRIERLSKELVDTDLELYRAGKAVYRATLKKNKNANRIRMYLFFLRHLHKYNIRLIYELLSFLGLNKFKRLLSSK